MGRGTPARSSRKGRGLSWNQLALAPIILITSKEAILGDWAVQRLVGLARERDSSIELTQLDAGSYSAGTLDVLASPSLFGEGRMIVVNSAEKMTDAFLGDALRYLANPQSDVILVIRHNGGVRGKKLLDAVDKAGFQHAVIDALTHASDKAEIVRDVVRGSGKRIAPEAVRMLVDALGSDVAELVSAARQLVSDIEGDISPDDVRTYYAGRTEVSGFAVADAAIAGNTGRAIALARHALNTGTGPVPIVAAVALKLRSMGLALALRNPAVDRKEVRLAPWQVDRARKDVEGWTHEGLARAILAIAQADAEVKGGSRDPQFAVERALLRIGTARHTGTKGPRP